MLYTRTGDGGTTRLFGTKERVAKDHPVIEALGSVDELNSLTGLCRAYAHTKDTVYAPYLMEVQEALFIAQAQLAGADKRITKAHVDDLEKIIGDIEATIEKPTSFVIPGATVLSALFDVARTVARRAERAVLATKPDPELRAYMNRLSSFFYALARSAAQEARIAECAPLYDQPHS